LGSKQKGGAMKIIIKEIKALKMLKLSLVIFVVGAMAACTGKQNLDTDTKKSSYAIGRQWAENIKRQKVEIDSKSLQLAIDDVFTDKESRLTQEEIQKAMIALQEQAVKKMSETAETSKAEGQKFLEANKTKAGVQSTSSGLQYQVMTAGTGASPKKTDKVQVHYKGTLINGEVFDSSYDRNRPVEFALAQVIPGWTEGLQLMKVGGKSKLFIPPDLAYGASPQPGIPGNSVLVFEVELINILKK
jgi:FKBP-type peptidyl-prolyl cis-trans isomerase